MFLKTEGLARVECLGIVPFLPCWDITMDMRKQAGILPKNVDRAPAKVKAFSSVLMSFAGQSAIFCRTALPGPAVERYLARFSSGKTRQQKSA